jgi:endonuclease YncB( thermonuclease family)
MKRCHMITLFASFVLTAVFSVLSLAALPTPATAQETGIERVPAGGAPPAGSGPLDVPGYVRVIDGDTVEFSLDGTLVGVGLVGIEAPQGNTACGKQATTELEGLVEGGIHLEEDADLTFDERARRMYYGFADDGQSIAKRLVAAGLARPTGHGKEAAELATAKSRAQSAQRGCLWGSRSCPTAAS